MIPRRIYFCGGGVNVIAHVGVLRYLSEHGWLSTVQEWIGVSAGSLIALCMVLGYSLSNIEAFYRGFDFNQLVDLDEFAPGWLVHFGIDTGNKVSRLIASLMRQKGVSDGATFEQLCRDGRGVLRVFATDLNTAKMVEYSPTLTPTFPVLTAIRASMSYPIYFQPVVCPVTGHLLVDGGVISNFPLHVLSAAELASTIGIYFELSVPVIENSEEVSLNDVVLRPVSLIMNARGQREVEKFPENVIRVVVGDMNPLNFSITSEEKEKLIVAGSEAAAAFFRRRRIVRRYSVS